MGSAPSATLARLMAEYRAADKLAKGARENETNQGTTRVAENPASLADHGIDKHFEGAPARRRHGQSSPALS
jgi:hypothetical protein